MCVCVCVCVCVDSYKPQERFIRQPVRPQDELPVSCQNGVPEMNLEQEHIPHASVLSNHCFLIDSSLQMQLCMPLIFIQPP